MQRYFSVKNVLSSVTFMKNENQNILANISFFHNFQCEVFFAAESKLKPNIERLIAFI